MKSKHLKAYMKCAEAFSECSPATRLKVGTVIVKDNNIIATGYNAQPKHIDEPCEDHNGKTCQSVRHSEMNALMALVRSGQSSVGATLICTHSSCKMCAIDIVDAGIERVIYKEDFRCSEGIEYLKENGVQVYKYEEG